MKALKGSQKKYLRALAHDLKPAAFVGQKGVTISLIKEINDGLDANELVKVKFVDFKEKNIKTALAMEIAQHTKSYLAGLIGHMAIYYRKNSDAQKHRIVIPE
ncbi:MAG: YhbY family RNA-binding protein [Desulfamplus sp.]|nr:YhbY family RNA-binding protein [Desulfamplus sp.]